MVDTDAWPEPEYNPGPRKHLHAIGVISSCYNSYEESIFELYQHLPTTLGLPFKLTSLYYRSVGERERLTQRSKRAASSLKSGLVRKTDT